LEHVLTPPSDTPPPVDARLRRLVEVGIGLGTTSSLDAVLQRVVEAAVELTEARTARSG
jgi:hypothetical protein